MEGFQEAVAALAAFAVWVLCTSLLTGISATWHLNNITVGEALFGSMLQFLVQCQIWYHFDIWSVALIHLV